MKQLSASVLDPLFFLTDPDLDPTQKPKRIRIRTLGVKGKEFFFKYFFQVLDNHKKCSKIELSKKKKFKKKYSSPYSQIRIFLTDTNTGKNNGSGRISDLNLKHYSQQAVLVFISRIFLWYL